MSSLLSSLKAELNRYYNLNNDLNTVINNLNDCIEKIEPASSRIAYYYNIDGFTADRNIVPSKKEALIAKRNELTGTVSSSISSQISIIKQKIRTEEARIEAARRRAAAAAKAAAAKKVSEIK